jgi:hypothetical protein
MDIATPTSTDAPEDAVVGDPPSIRVPSIPVTTDLSRPPVAVPSMTVPAPSLPTTSIRIAPVPASSPRESPAACNGVTESPEMTSPDPTRSDQTPPDQTPPDQTPPDLAPPDQTSPDQSGFSPHVAAKLRSYVYLLVDPRSGRAFCVARGRDDRCFRHVAAARGGPQGYLADTPGRLPKFAMLDRIRQIEDDGRPVRIDILRYGLSASEASLVAASVSEALGLPVDPRLGSQRRPVTEVASLLAKRAKFKREHQVVLLRVGGTGVDPTYERARHGWRVGRRWTDPGSPRSPQWAVVVVADMITAVYRIERWEPTPVALSGRGRRAAAPIGRYSLVGSPDPALEDRYVGKSVAAYLGDGSPSPVTYVRCGPHWVNTAR